MHFHLKVISRSIRLKSESYTYIEFRNKIWRILRDPGTTVLVWERWIGIISVATRNKTDVLAFHLVDLVLTRFNPKFLLSLVYIGTPMLFSRYIHTSMYFVICDGTPTFYFEVRILYIVSVTVPQRCGFFSWLELNDRGDDLKIPN